MFHEAVIFASYQICLKKTNNLQNGTTTCTILLTKYEIDNYGGLEDFWCFFVSFLLYYISLTYLLSLIYSFNFILFVLFHFQKFQYFCHSLGIKEITLWCRTSQVTVKRLRSSRITEKEKLKEQNEGRLKLFREFTVN